MKSYGQFCPLALASEVVGERWTMLVLRELAWGPRRFNEIQRGVPLMSPALLTRRLGKLAQTGILERLPGPGGRVDYALTEAGEALMPAIEALAVWGKAWLPANLSQIEADHDLVMWDLHRLLRLEQLPAAGVTIWFGFLDRPPELRERWIVAGPDGSEYCLSDPGREVDLWVTTDSRTITWIWYGDIPLADALSEGLLRLDGAPRLCRAFPTWLQLNPLAEVPRRTKLRP